MRVHEMFYSLQGEGREAGMPAYFLRLSGCNQRCSFCDSKSAWTQGAECTDLHQLADGIYENMMRAGCQNLIITGGEPLIYSENELPILINRLEYLFPAIKIHMETSGYSGNLAWIRKNEKIYQDLCVHLSPKLGYGLPETFWIQKATEIRFPVSSKEDIENVKNWINAHDGLFDKRPIIYLSPIIENLSAINTLLFTPFFKELVKAIKSDTIYDFRLSVQQHKWWGIR